MAQERIKKRFRVYGIVQGVGFRPTVDRHATATKITGTVSNRGPFVEIIAEGLSSQVTDFITRLREEPPERAVILKIDEKLLPAGDFHADFSIVESEKTQGEIFVSPDIAMCDTCKAELYDSGNRRYLHPFINCTSCGPRLTILDALPYDRERTSMKVFPMCPDCAAEYTSPTSRRYDAQPVCCNVCGPTLYLLEKTDGAFLPGKEHASATGQEALQQARDILREGKILAIKGIGGYHLSCDATNSAAVSRLRALKHRPVKPFAVMARDLEAVRRECTFTPAQESILTGHQKPILLLQTTSEGCIVPEVAPDNPTLGIMLPYAPVQQLLFDYPDDKPMPDVLVMTSGNVSGAPIARTDEDAIEMLTEFCDGILSNNRMIRVRTDDTVMDFHNGAPYMIRRSRGYAPLPVLVSQGLSGQVLAIGGELKNSFCLSRDDLHYPSSYIGDLADVRTVEALRASIEKMEELLELSPQLITCDLHPGYQSTQVAKDLSKARGIPLLPIQHHYAHVVSCMAENDVKGPVIGVSFDGTGYGDDGTIWGGEIFTCDYQGYKRRASIVPFLHAGGDIAAKEGWRIAISMLYGIEKATGASDKAAQETVLEISSKLNLADSNACKAQFFLLDRQVNTVVSTSAGRLFDSVCALLGICQSSTFEGEAANRLMFSADRYEKSFSTRKEAFCSLGAFRLSETALLPARNTTALLPTQRLFALLRDATLAGEPSDKLAYAFHVGLSDVICQAVKDLSGETGISKVACSGGVFQNRLLLSLTEDGLRDTNLTVYTHHLIPPNDGGICLGQAVAGMYYLNSNKDIL